MEGHDEAHLRMGLGEADDAGGDPRQAAVPVLPAVGGDDDVGRARVDGGRDRVVLEGELERGRIEESSMPVFPVT